MVAFLCQQSVEKALKALFINKLRKAPGSAHSLVYLGKSVDAPERIIQILKKLAPDYVLTRYPNVASGVPYEMHDEEVAKERIEFAKEVGEKMPKEVRNFLNEVKGSLILIE
ncbi:MAG: HEPN domain-containing protein [Candidatus Bathyarchaeia archaeon]